MNKKINEYLTRIAKAKNDLIDFLNTNNIEATNSDSIEDIVDKIKGLNIQTDETPATTQSGSVELQCEINDVMLSGNAEEIGSD
jgi:hypothetical protein